MPKQFDIWRHRTGQLVVILQNDLLDNLNSRVVAPLMLAGKYRVSGPGLNPQVTVSGQDYHIVTAHMSVTTNAELAKLVGSASHLRDDIIRALDLLFTGV